MELNNCEALAVLKWMVRTRLLETMCEAEPKQAFERRIMDDFAELTEAGVVTYAELFHGDDGVISVKLHRDGERFVFRAAMAEGRIQIERRATCL